MIDATRWLLYRPDELDLSKPLWLVRDVMDLDALRGSGINAVAFKPAAGIANGENVFEKAAHFFQQFPSLFIAISENDESISPPLDIADEIADFSPRLLILTPRPGAFGRFRNIREALRGGRDKVDHLILGAIERPMPGLIEVSKAKYVDISQDAVILSGFPALDVITGGFREGQLNIWTAAEGEGKSTLLGQILLNTVEQGVPVCAYSGELNTETFKLWLWQQAAGPQNTRNSQSKLSKKWYSVVNDNVIPKIDKWFENKLFLYDRTVCDDSVEKIVELFAYAERRYGCSVFLVDNFMTLQTVAKTSSQLAEQNRIINELDRFAKSKNVTIHLVAHVRKLTGGEKKANRSTDSISGTSIAKNAAFYIFYLEQVPMEEREVIGCDSKLSVWKNRLDGMKGTVELKFDRRSRRLHQLDTDPEDAHYGWERL